MNDLFRKSYDVTIFENRQKLASRYFIPKIMLDQNAIERWINEILREACVNEKQNNLKKLGLDRNSLKSAGVKDEDINRLYRSMFVYTVGFYEMLQDILKNVQLTATIWQVFGILLEYIAKGDFQLTINQIYKESQQQIEELNETMTKRENKFRSIETKAQEEINKLQTLLQDLNDQNNLLKLQRDNADMDFQQSNTAFEEEVTLRIRFQNKIIEITSIYRELVQNYTQLSDELNELRILYDKINNDLMKSKKHLETVIAEADIKDNIIINSNQSIENLRKLLDEKENKILIQELQINKLSQNFVQDQSISMNYEHQFNQLCMQFAKYKEGNIHNLQELEKCQRNYKDTLDLNKKLTNENQTIKQDNIRLQNENKQQKITIQSFEQLEQGYRSSILQLQQEIRDLIEEHKEKIKKFQTIQVEYEFGTQRISVQQDEIQTLNQNIQEMKFVRTHLEELFIQEKAQIQQLQNVLEVKEQNIKDYQECLSLSQLRLDTLLMEMNELENKLKQDFTATEISYQKQIKQLQETIEEQKQELMNEGEKFVELQNRLEYQRQEFEEVKSLYKVVIFENNNLITKQQFSDHIMGIDKKRIGELINEITNIRVIYEESLKNYRKLEIKQDEQVRQIEKDKSFLIDQYGSKINNQKEMVHKMILEDTLSLWDRTNQKLITLDQSYQHMNEQSKLLKNQNLKFHKEIEELDIKLKQKINLVQKLNIDYNKSCNDLKIVKFKQLVYFASLNYVNIELKQKTENLLQIENSNEELKKELKRVKEENFNQKRLISRQRISIQDQKQQYQIEDYDSTNDFQDYKNRKEFRSDNQIIDNSFDQQSISIKNQGLLQNQTKKLKKAKFQNEIEKIEEKIFEIKQENYRLKLGQQSKTVDLRQSLVENKSDSQNRRQNSIQIQADLHKISFEKDKIQESPFLQSRSISVSQGSKSQRNKNQKGQMDFLMRVKKNTLIKNAKMNSKQFSQLFQITRNHYQS